jgi:hypothetical protein
MKKNLLLMMLCVPVILVAQNGVTVSNLAVDAGTVTFNVSWKSADMPEVWSDTVWVFVDYNKNGVMERLPLLSGATLTATSAPGEGKVIEETGNDKGVWIVGDARSADSFSATVQLFTTENVVAGACAYASNYSPVGEYTSATNISFTGTPPYNIVLKDAEGSTEIRTESSPYTVSTGYIVQSFTDKTAAVGKLACIPSTAYTLTASASSFCAGGAGVTFALSGTEPGRIYQLYRDGTTVVATLTGDGNTATFCEAVNEAGIYTARAVALPEYCPATMNGSLLVESVSPEAPAMGGSSSYCTSGTITATAGSGGNGIRWTDNESTAALRTVTATGTYRAVTTSVSGCISSPATISVTILLPGTSGDATTVCGCASGLSDCSGTCQPYCGNFTACSGFTEVTNNPHDGSTYGGLAYSETTCSSLGSGWRKPTLTELKCMCSNKAILPGGLPRDWYWSSSVDEVGKYIHLRPTDCGTRSVTTTAAWVKCVK